MVIDQSSLNFLQADTMNYDMIRKKQKVEQNKNNYQNHSVTNLIYSS
jgi:hypothetical protein